MDTRSGFGSAAAAVLLAAWMALLIQAVPISVSAQVRAAERHPVLILKEGDLVPGTGGRVVDYLSGPEHAGGDHVGVVAVLSDGEEGALWVGHHAVGLERTVLATDVGATTFVPERFGVAADRHAGTSDLEGVSFVVKAVMADARVALLTNRGVVQWLGETAPGLPENATVSSIERIQMLLNGQVYWVADWQAQAEWGRAFFRRQPGPWGRVELLMNKGDPVCDGELENLLHFRVAQDQTRGHVLDVRAGTGTRRALYVGGKCPFAEMEPLPGSDERPMQFLFFDVDSDSRVLFGALTDAPAYRNAVFALDGRVVMREGDVIGGVQIQPPCAEPNQVRLDDRGRAVTLWAGLAGMTYTILYTPDIRRFGETRHLVSEGSPLDFDGDGTADANLHRFRFFAHSGPTMSLADTGVYVAVWLTFPGSSRSVAAVVFLPL